MDDINNKLKGEPPGVKSELALLMQEDVSADLSEAQKVAVNLDIVKLNKEVVTNDSRDIAVKQAQALEVLAKATNEIASFITGSGLSSLLSGYARSQAVKDILGGLAAHDGRNSLDARVLGQNALEITEAVEAVFMKYAERMAEKERGEEREDLN